MIRAAENAKSSRHAGTLLKPKSWRAVLADLLPEEWVFDPLEDDVLHKPDSAASWFALARAEHQRGYYEDALIHYSSAIDLNIDFAQALFYRGCVQLALRQYQEAIEDFSRAIEIDPRYLQAYSQRGIAKERLLLYEDAIQDHNTALILKGRPVRAKPRRSLTSELIGRTANATRLYIIQPLQAFIEKYIRANRPIPSVRAKAKKKKITPKKASSLAKTLAAKYASAVKLMHTFRERLMMRLWKKGVKKS